MPDGRRAPPRHAPRVADPAARAPARDLEGRDGAAGSLRRLRALGVVRTTDGQLRTTRRWQAAMARAAARLQRAGAPWQDLRLPMAVALVELAPGLGDDELARCVEALVPIEEAELGALFAHEHAR